MIRVVKIGGNVIDDEQILSRFLDLFVQLPLPKVLVHGGGKLATRLCEQLGIKTQMIDGRRVTDKDTLDVVTMVYAGLVNKHIVAQLQTRGQKAIGLSGADANLIPAHRRSPIPVDYGFVGDIVAEEVNADFLQSLLQQGIVPVVCPLTHDGKGSMLNSNADGVASAVAIAASRIDETQLVYCFEKQGVLSDIENEDSVIPRIDAISFEQLKTDGVISKGMLPKISSSMKAIESGVGSVVIKHADNLLNTIGTTIVK